SQAILVAVGMISAIDCRPSRMPTSRRAIRSLIPRLPEDVPPNLSRAPRRGNRIGAGTERSGARNPVGESAILAYVGGARATAARRWGWGQMRRMTPIIAAAVTTVALGSSVIPVRAQAQSATTFVSGNGSDANPCTHTAPCRSFAAAVLVTSPGGQVTMLDPAGYGAVTITKAISIVNDGGGEAGINDPGAGLAAITINAGASDVVNPRGLALNGGGTGQIGIEFQGGAALNIQNCVIRDFTGDGVLAGTNQPATVTIFDTIVSHNNPGIQLIGGNAPIIVHLERVAAIGNSTGGIDLFGGPLPTAPAQGMIVDSVAIDNGPNTSGYGFSLTPGPNSAITLVNSKAIHNGTGLGVGSAGTTYISQTILAGNVTHGFNNGGTLKTFGDNYIIDTNNSGSLTPIGEQ